ncbi:MAG: HDOD domain-containing protein [Bdellovibrionales bacterium]|nr:HDOD domain-containing protein [Bdellovibrionales bacterium]
MSEDHDEGNVIEGEEGQSEDGGKGLSGPLGLSLPAEANALREARRIIGDGNSRVDNLATVCLQDPVIIIELLKKSNALFFAGGRAPITSPKTAIVRLGSDVVLELFEKLNERQVITDPDQFRWFEKYRSRSKRIGIVSRIFAEALARGFSEDCQAIGSLASIGDMLAVAHFGATYVELADEHQRSGVNYRLVQNHKFDVDKMGVSYLRRNGIPEALLFAIDREARPRSADRAIMKPLCMAAAELVDAFDLNRWEKLAPGKRLPPKSALRMLQMTDTQYLRIYERTSEYLFSARMLEEKKIQESREAEPAPHVIEDEETLDLEKEIQSILDDALTEPESSPEAAPEEQHVAPEAALEEVPKQRQGTTVIQELPESLGEVDQQFGLSSSRQRVKAAPRHSEKVSFVEPPKLRTNKGTKFVNDVASLMEDAQSSEELLSNILQKLVDGPFEKAALIVVSHDRKYAIVVAARGPIGNGQRIELNDPLSPLAQCFSKVQSFATRANEASPFGCKSFALSPIDADHDTPVALYADCGDKGALTFEARRIFRTVVEILNQKLPSIPGGIPVELQQTAP